jgi:hypothetical protein
MITLLRFRQRGVLSESPDHARRGYLGVLGVWTDDRPHIQG